MASNEHREVVADWLMVVGAAGLFGSLFLAWSHQFSAPFLAQFGTSVLLDGVPHNPTAWQVYSAVDVVLALLALVLVGIALRGSRATRLCALVGVAVAAAFVLHAVAVPPTNGADIFNPALSVPQYVSPGATAAAGETVALAGLGVALVGLLLSFTAD